MKIRSVVILCMFVLALVTSINAYAGQSRTYVDGRSGTEPPFSGAVMVGDTLYLAGSLGLDEGKVVACPNREVIDIDGDGSFLMNIQELATAKIEKIAAKALILNNQHLGMVVQWEDHFYAGNRGHTYLGNPDNTKETYPDYPAICAGFGVKCERVIFKKDLIPAMKRMLAAKEPYVLEVVTPYTEHVLPFIPAGHTVADMIY